MPIASMPDLQIYAVGKSVDRKRARKDGMRNVMNRASRASTENRAFVDNRYTKTPLQITSAGLQHGIIGTSGRLRRNAGAASVAGDIAANAIPINRLTLDEKDVESGVKEKYLYIQRGQQSAQLADTAQENPVGG